MAERKSIFSRIFNRPKKEENSNVVTESIAVNNLITTARKALNSTDLNDLDSAKQLELFRQMDNDAIISAALDLYADNATQVDEKTGHVIAVESHDKKFQEEINDFLWNTVNIDTEAWQIIRDIVRDGYIFLDTKASQDGRNWAFTPVQDPSKIKALTYGQGIVKYFAVAPEEQDEDNPYFSNFTVLTDNTKDNYDYKIEPHDRFIVGFNTSRVVGKMTVETTTRFGESRQEELDIRVGRSILAPVVQTWETLSAMEDALFINRLTKSRQFKIVEVNVTDSTNKQAKQIMDSVKNAFKSSETIDETINKYQNRQSPIPVEDFIFVPVKDEKGSIEVNSIGGEVGEVDTGDIDYYRNKLFAGLGVLKAYLGFEETTPGGLGDTTLTKLDERLGRRVVRLKNILHNVVDQIIKYYWKNSASNRTLENIPKYTIISGKVSTNEEDDKRERLISNLNIASDIVSMATSEIFADYVSKEKLFNYVFNNVIGIDVKYIDNTPIPDDVPIRVKKLVESAKSINNNDEIFNKHNIHGYTKKIIYDEIYDVAAKYLVDGVEEHEDKIVVFNYEIDFAVFSSFDEETEEYDVIVEIYDIKEYDVGKLLTSYNIPFEKSNRSESIYFTLDGEEYRVSTHKRPPVVDGFAVYEHEYDNEIIVSNEVEMYKEVEKLLKNRKLTESKNKEEQTKVYEGKLRNILTESVINELKTLLESEVIEFEDNDGNKFNITEIENSKGHKDLLYEYTYSQLKELSKNLDPARLNKAKKSTAKYMGLDDDNNIVFVVTAENPDENKSKGKPTSYITRVKMNELDWVVDVNEKEGRRITDRDIVRLAIGGDLQVSCTCPAAKYWGQQYRGTKEKYSLDKNTIKPTRNIPLQVVCKHTLATLIALPFWNNSIVRDLRLNGTIKPKPKKPSKKNNKQNSKEDK